ncbi:hypothetical protein [Nocardiopsis sp. L17-MgMaSL7]|uniref:hypothetical protein n=1 Tax=Nocardiopsis sp. L17-MgMaSL7 TaxID=1938893 RepID=UPI000D70AA27|nr:hypothetical protein [Nocardiopsis sp. L17-MgMaSL7]PWV51074.1 hypothetical protein BDW27_107140 [Nocardiopsis sp. L17-MgMaSL7]
MKRSFRTTVLALATSGLVVVGSSACSSEEVIDTVSSVGSSQAGDDSGAAVVTEPRNGELEYLAPGKFIIDGEAFFVTEETRYLGGHHVCPAENGLDENAFGIVECDLESFEAAAQGETRVFVQAMVDENGNAESITEYDNDSHHEPGEPEGPEAPEESGGFTGTLAGGLDYVAPGEYVVEDTAFFVSEDTVIHAGIYACADGVQDPDTGLVTCDFDEFDAAVASGNPVLAEVEIVDGIATSITEY